MHEMHLMRDLFDDLMKHARDQRASKITKVYLRMGDLTEINEEILRHYFSCHGHGTALEGAEIEIEKSPAREIRLVSFDCE